MLLCPDCPPAREARRIVFGADFWPTLAIAVVPFVLTLALVWLLLRWRTS
jgi:hypothetical protein